jgi:hypothetical protein
LKDARHGDPFRLSVLGWHESSFWSGLVERELLFVALGHNFIEFFRADRKANLGSPGQQVFDGNLGTWFQGQSKSLGFVAKALAEEFADRDEALGHGHGISD